MMLRDPDLLRTRAFIDGKWVDAGSGATHTVVNPATCESIGTVPDMGAAETRRAIEAAGRAFPAWAALTARSAPRSCAAGTNCSWRTRTISPHS